MNIGCIPTWLGLLSALCLMTAYNRIYDGLSGRLGNTIVFSYLIDDNQGHLQEYVDGIDVFIFDAKGEVPIERYRLERERLLSPLEVTLPGGDYKMVTVGNTLTEAIIGKEDSYKGSLASRPEPMEKDGRVSSAFDKLYLGETAITSRVMNESRDIVRLYSQHVKVHAVILSDDDSNSQAWFKQNKEAGFRLIMESFSAHFYLSGQRAGEAFFDLPFVTGKENDRFVLDFNTLRFDDEDSLTIRLMQNGKVLCTVDVARYIARYPEQIRIAGRQEVVLSLFLRQNPLSLSISVKPWEAVDVVPITD